MRDGGVIVDRADVGRHEGDGERAHGRGEHDDVAADRGDCAAAGGVVIADDEAKARQVSMHAPDHDAAIGDRSVRRPFADGEQGVSPQAPATGPWWRARWDRL